MAVNARIVITLERDMSDADFAQFVNGVTAFVRSANRIGNVQVVVDAGGGPPPEPGGTTPVSGTWIALTEGRVEVGPNEMSVVSTTPGQGDPAGLRLASLNGEGLGHESGNSVRPTDGRQEMVVFRQFKRWEGMRSLGIRNLFGVIEDWFRDPRLSTNDDRQFRKGTSLEPDGFHFHVPIWLHSYPVHVGAVAPEPVMLTAGILRAIMAVAAHLGDRHTQQAIGAPADEGAFTSADDPDTLRMITRMREQDEACAKASE